MTPTTHWAAVDPDDIALLYGSDCEPAWPAEPVRDTHTLPDISEYQETDMDDDQVDVPAEQRTIPADYLDDQRIDLGAHIPGYAEALAAMAETCVHFSEHGWGRCVEPRDHAPGKHMYRNPKL